MKNWEPKLAALITAMAGFVTFSPALFAQWPWVGAVAKWIMLGGMVGTGAVAKSYSTHSTVAEVRAASGYTKDTIPERTVAPQTSAPVE